MNVARFVLRNVAHNAQLIRQPQPLAHRPGASDVCRRLNRQGFEGWRARPQHWPCRTLSTSIHQEAQTDTIYALSTAPGRAAIAVVRISGPAYLEVRLQPRTAYTNGLTDFA